METGPRTPRRTPPHHLVPLHLLMQEPPGRCSPPRSGSTPPRPPSWQVTPGSGPFEGRLSIKKCVTTRERTEKKSNKKWFYPRPVGVRGEAVFPRALRGQLERCMLPLTCRRKRWPLLLGSAAILQPRRGSMIWNDNKHDMCQSDGKSSAKLIRSHDRRSNLLSINTGGGIMAVNYLFLNKKQVLTYKPALNALTGTTNTDYVGFSPWCSDYQRLNMSYISWVNYMLKQQQILMSLELIQLLTCLKLNFLLHLHVNLKATVDLRLYFYI